MACVVQSPSSSPAPTAADVLKCPASEEVVAEIITAVDTKELTDAINSIDINECVRSSDYRITMRSMYQTPQDKLRVMLSIQNADVFVRNLLIEIVEYWFCPEYVKDGDAKCDGDSFGTPVCMRHSPMFFTRFALSRFHTASLVEMVNCVIELGLGAYAAFRMAFGFSRADVFQYLNEISEDDVSDFMRILSHEYKWAANRYRKEHPCECQLVDRNENLFALDMRSPVMQLLPANVAFNTMAWHRQHTSATASITFNNPKRKSERGMDNNNQERRSIKIRKRGEPEADARRITVSVDSKRRRATVRSPFPARGERNNNQQKWTSGAKNHSENTRRRGGRGGRRGKRGGRKVQQARQRNQEREMLRLAREAQKATAPATAAPTTRHDTDPQPAAPTTRHDTDPQPAAPTTRHDTDPQPQPQPEPTSECINNDDNEDLDFDLYADLDVTTNETETEDEFAMFLSSSSLMRTLGL